MPKRIALLLACATLLAAGPALAQTATPAPEKTEKAAKPKGQGTPQTHHCYKDGKLFADMTHKHCTVEGGIWKKDVDAKAEAAKPASKAEPKAEPKAEAAPAK
jgi:hypothetical protein